MGPPQSPLTVSGLAPAKLNLSLRIRGRRSDGYHLLESSMVPISLYDRLRLTFVPGARTEISCRTTRTDVPTDGANLAGRAALLFMRRTNLVGTVSIVIEKEIPIGAGLGGGSSDAATVLRMMASACGSDVDVGRLASWSVELGADVPFFVYGRPARVEGIGEIVGPSSMLPLTGALVVAFPGTGVSTAEVYAAYDRSLTRATDLSREDILASDQRSNRDVWVNDLETAAMRISPAVRALKERLYELGASDALMTGSGSAVFGMWEDGLGAQAAVEMLSRSDGLWARRVEIIERTPDVEIRDSRSLN